MNALWSLLIGLAIFAAGASVGDMISEEIRTRLDEVPMALVRFAARRAGADVSADLLDEWRGELYEILCGAEARPITRLWKGMRFSVGLIVAARTVGRTLGPRILPRDDHRMPLRVVRAVVSQRGRRVRYRTRAPAPIAVTPRGRQAIAQAFRLFREAGEPLEGVVVRFLVDVDANAIVALVRDDGIPRFAQP